MAFQQPKEKQIQELIDHHDNILKNVKSLTEGLKAYNETSILSDAEKVFDIVSKSKQKLVDKKDKC